MSTNHHTGFALLSRSGVLRSKNLSLSRLLLSGCAPGGVSMRRAIACSASLVVASAALVLGTSAPGISSDDRLGSADRAQPARVTASRAVYRIRLLGAVRRLPLARETRAGYDREKFRLWVDADGDCRDTRDEVLAAESKDPVSGCDINRGKWRSYYDGRTWRRSSDVDIDHLVPLAEAWDSGAKRWDANTRERYANDLGTGGPWWPSRTT